MTMGKTWRDRKAVGLDGMQRKVDEVLVLHSLSDLAWQLQTFKSEEYLVLNREDTQNYTFCLLHVHVHWGPTYNENMQNWVLLRCNIFMVCIGETYPVDNYLRQEKIIVMDE